VASGVLQTEARFHSLSQQQQERITVLGNELNNKENLLQTKEQALQALQLESRNAIASLEDKLNDAASLIEKKDAELREKKAVLASAAATEKVLGQLMQELAAHSQSLIAEVKEKSELISGLEKKIHLELDHAAQSDAMHEGLL
jgi:hypothetical protein